MSGIREYSGALQTGLLSAMKRPRHLVLTGAGFIIAALTLLILLTLPAGLAKLAGHTGSNDTVVVLPGGSFNDEGSHRFSVDQLHALQTLPGIAHDEQDRPLLAPQFVAYAKLRHTDGRMGTVLLRGVTPAFYEVAGASVSLSQGHHPRAGHDESMAGSGAVAAYVALHPGDQTRIHHQAMRSVGVFNAGAGFWNSEIWMSQDVLQSVFGQPAAITSVWVKLQSPNSYPKFLHALRANRSLSGVTAAPQRQFYAGQTRFLGHYVHIATVSVAIVLGLGAILAITNALSIALNARRRELAIMRATGYQQAPLAWALLTEVWLLGTVCVGLVALAAFIFWNGHSIDSSTLLHAVSFKADVNAKVVLLTLGYTLLIGTISAFIPIQKAVRAPLVNALHTT